MRIIMLIEPRTEAEHQRDALELRMLREEALEMTRDTPARDS
jgi:hypothetical protein